MTIHLQDPVVPLPARALSPEPGAPAPGPQTELLGVRFLNVDLSVILGLLSDVIDEGRQETVSFVNANCLNIASGDGGYRALLNRQDLVLPDGIGVSIGCRMTGTRMAANLNGTDLLPHLCGLAVRKGTPMFLLGAREGVAARMAARLEAQHPGLDVCGHHHGYFQSAEETDAVIERINAAQPGLLLVAMGTPDQERWIETFRERIDARLLVGVGGLFDFYSGDKPRAPRLVRRLGMEWAFRLALEPRRLFRRYVVGNPAFLARVAWSAVTGRRSDKSRAKD